MKRIGMLALMFAWPALAGTDRFTARIATVSPLSGAQAAQGEMIKLGAQLALEDAQPALESLGLRLDLMPQDDQAQPDVGVAVARRLINEPAVLAVIGHYNSGVAIPASEVYREKDLPLVSPANTHPRITDRGYPNISRICGRDDVQGPVGADYAVGELNARRIFVLHDKTAYGQGIAEAFRARAEALGATVIAFAGTEEKTNFQSLILQLRALKPDFLYFGGMYDQAGVLLKQLRERRVTVPVMGPDGCDSSEILRLAGFAADGFLYTAVAGPPEVFPRAADFAERFRARFNKAPETYAFYAYDCGRVIAAALEAALREQPGRLPSREEVGRRIRATTLDGLTGPIAFNPKGDRRRADYYVLQIEAQRYPGVIRNVLSASPPSP